MSDLNFADQEFSGERFKHWFAHMIEERELTIEEIAEELGYSRASTINMWLEGKSRPCWDHIPAIARMLVVDKAVLLPLFVEMHITDRDIREEIFEAACRIVPEWEYPLHVIARNLYITGEESIWTWMPDYMA